MIRTYHRRKFYTEKSELVTEKHEVWEDMYWGKKIFLASFRDRMYFRVVDVFLIYSVLNAMLSVTMLI